MVQLSILLNQVYVKPMELKDKDRIKLLEDWISETKRFLSGPCADVLWENDKLLEIQCKLNPEECEDEDEY